MSELCQHLPALTSLKTAPQRIWRYLGGPACVPGLRPRRLLRRFQNKHATQHFLATQRPVVSSAGPRERWLWCYVHEEMAGY